MRESTETHPCTRPAQVIWIVDTRIMRGVTVNLSQSGIQVEVPELTRQANVHLTFRLRARSRSLARGKAARNRIQVHGRASHDSVRHFIDERIADSTTR